MLLEDKEPILIKIYIDYSFSKDKAEPNEFGCTLCYHGRELMPCTATILQTITSYLAQFQKELSQISRTTRQNMIKICENLRQGNSNHHERFHAKEQIFLLHRII